MLRAFFSSYTNGVLVKSCPLCHHNDSRPKYKIEDFDIVQCRDCGFVYLNHEIETRDEELNYEMYFESTTLDDYTDDSEDINIQQARLINSTRLHWVQSRHPQGRLLDVGCGRGFFLKHAIDAGYEVEGVELSVSAAQYATEHFNVPVHVSNLEHERAFSNEYDVITLWHVLEHFHQPVTVLQNLWTMLAPGGTLYVEVPNLNSVKFRLSAPGTRWQGGNHPRYHRSFFTQDTLQRALRHAGYIDLQHRSILYPVQKNPMMRGVKRLLQLYHLDSFLQMEANAR